MKNRWTIAGALMAVISVPFAEGVRAEDPMAAGTETSSVPVSGVPSSSFSERSESTALLWSLLGTVVPAALSAPVAFGESEGSGDGTGAAFVFLGSLVVGPALGHFYAGRPGRALLGIGIRTTALVGLSAAIAMSWDEDTANGDALAVASLSLGAASIAWDIASAPGSARQYNDVQRRSRVRLGLGPVGSTGAPGVLVAASF